MPFIDLSTLNTKEIAKGFHSRGVHTGTTSYMYLNVEEGAELPLHSHMHEQMSHVLEGKFQFTLDGETRVLEPGIVVFIPPHASHGGKALTACKLLDVFNPERNDYKF